MQINSPLKKGFALAVIVLFIGVGITPLTGSIVVEKSSMPTFNDPTIVSIQPPSQTVEKGETFWVSVYIEPGEPIIGANVDYLYFDPNILQVMGTSYDGFFGSWPPPWPPPFDNVNGYVYDMIELISGPGSVSNPGPWVTIVFEAQQLPGTSYLDLEGVIIANATGSEAPIEVYDGSVTVLDDEPPQIIDVTLTHSIPKDTSLPGNPACFSGGWENFSCTVTSDGTLDVVQLNFSISSTDPWKGPIWDFNVPMSNVGDTYYYNTTLPAGYCGYALIYEYHIWANDTNGNQNSTLPETFFKPSNADVDMSGKVHFMDLIAVARRYGDVGPCGWIREDVNNDGRVHFMDLIAIARHYCL